MRKLLDWPVRRPRAALLLALVMTAGAVWSASRLRPETALAGLLDPSDPAARAMDQTIEQFPVVNELLVLATAADEQPDQLIAFAERFAQAVERDAGVKELITHVRWRPDESSRAFVENVVIPNAAYYLSEEQFEEALHRLTPAEMKRQIARSEAMLSAPGPAAGGLARTLAKDPLRLHEFIRDRLGEIAPPGAALGQEAFFSPDRRSILIRIGGAKSPSDIGFATELTEQVRRLAQEVNHDKLRIDITGGYAMAAHSAAKIRGDTIADVVSTVIALVLLFVIACRRPGRMFIFSFVPVAAGIVWGFGAYGLMKRTITPLAAVVGGTLGAIGLDYTVHYLTHYHKLRRAPRESAKAQATAAAIGATSREMFFPSLAAWLTSVIGFAAIAISPVQVLRDFAILGTLCLIGAWVGTLMLLPAILARFALGGALPYEGRFDVADVIGQWIARHARGLLVLCIIVTAAVAGALAVRGVKYRLESDPLVLHPQPSPPLEAQRRVAEVMRIWSGGVTVHLQAQSAEELLTTAYRAQRRMDDEAVRSAGISRVFGLASLLPEPMEARRRRESLDPDLPKRVAEDLKGALAESSFHVDAFDQYVQFVQKLVAPGDPPGVDELAKYPELARLLLPRDVLEGKPATQALVLVFTRAPIETTAAREAALAAARSAVGGMSGVVVTGMAAIGHDVDMAIRRDLPRFVALALVCVFAYLALHLRSVKLAGLALLPIAISLLCVAAFISLFEVKLNLLHTVMAPLLLGINVDYGIFAVHAWKHSSDEHGLLAHFPASFAGLMLCGGATIIGFGSLVITSVPAVRSLGWLINIGVGTCVFSTLLMLWPAMIVIRRRMEPQMNADERG